MSYVCSVHCTVNRNEQTKLEKEEKKQYRAEGTRSIGQFYVLYRSYKRQRKRSLIKIDVRQNRKRGDEGGRNSIENGGANKTEGLTK
jgi:hypothetical protein